jgi:hypothetical protein
MNVTKLVAAVVVILAVLFSTNAYAGNRIVPTDVLDPQQFYFGIYHEGSLGFSKVENFLAYPADGNREEGEFLTPFYMGFGLFPNCDMVMKCAFISTHLEMIDEEFIPPPGEMEMERRTEGFTDTEFNIRYRMPFHRESPINVAVGLIQIFPTGKRTEGHYEYEEDGIKYDNKKLDYPGEGVFKYGEEFAVSGAFGVLEPYLGLSYIIGGQRNIHRVSESYSDDVTLDMGLQVHTLAKEVRVGAPDALRRFRPNVSFDFRLRIIRHSTERRMFEPWDRSWLEVREKPYSEYSFIQGIYFEMTRGAVFFIRWSYNSASSRKMTYVVPDGFKYPWTVKISGYYSISFAFGFQMAF